MYVWWLPIIYSTVHMRYAVNWDSRAVLMTDIRLRLVVTVRFYYIPCAMSCGFPRIADGASHSGAHDIIWELYEWLCSVYRQYGYFKHTST